METYACQMHCLQRISEGSAGAEPLPPGRRLYRALTRPLSPRVKRAIKANLSKWFFKFIGRSNVLSTATTTPTTASLKAGDTVRVRSKEGIQSTLNPWKQLKGCGFLDGMWQYSGTTQRVLKPMEIFLDERDYRVKKCRGIVLLEGLMCQGTREFGRCDRSCLFFWREEWLEKID